MVCYLFRICAFQTVNYLRKWVVARLTLTVSRPDWGGVVPLFSHRWCILQPQPLGPTLNCLTFHCPRGLLHDKFIFGQLDRYWCWDWDTNDSFVQNHPAAQLNVTVMAAALPFLLSRSLSCGDVLGKSVSPYLRDLGQVSALQVRLAIGFAIVFCVIVLARRRLL